MPAEDVKKFLAQVKKDARLRKQLERHAKSASAQVVKIARKHGYKISKEELHDHLKKEWKAKKLPSSKKAAAFVVIVP